MLLRAEAIAVVAAGEGALRTVFAHRIAAGTDWARIIGEDAFERSSASPFTFPIPAGRWADEASFAVAARLEAFNGPALLIAVRRSMPFDAVEGLAAEAAARLLAMTAVEGRSLAEAERRLAEVEQRLAMQAGLRVGLAETRDTTSLLAHAATDVARRMGAGAASIMVVEGSELRLRASVGLPGDIALGHSQRVGEGIAGWVAASGEKVVLRGPVSDERFSGFDPDAREAVVMPLRYGEDVLGVLNLKRPNSPSGFGDKQGMLDAIADDLARALHSISAIAALERDQARSQRLTEVVRAAALGDVDAAVRAAGALGHHAVALRDRGGRVVGLYAAPEDVRCREAALAASASLGQDDPGLRVGFARHDEPYRTEEAELSGRVADTLALLGQAQGLRRESRQALRVLAVEDHPVMRLGVRALLEREGFTVAGLTATCGEALDLVAETAPDVVLLDLHLPDAAGAEAVARLRAVAPNLPIVVFTVDRSPQLVRAAVRAGANGYVSKDASSVRVVAALHAAVAGLTAFGPEESAALVALASAETNEVEHGLERSETPPGTEPAAKEPLTPRELELLRYMAEGYTNKEIARAMVLAEDTVKKGVQLLIAKLGAADRTHTVVLALRNRLIE